jgi:hypothetical protein
MFSPVPKKTFDTTISANASARSPGPIADKSAVPSTQPDVVIASSFFLTACASAYAPTMGAVTMTIA